MGVGSLEEFCTAITCIDPIVDQVWPWSDNIEGDDFEDEEM